MKILIGYVHLKVMISVMLFLIVMLYACGGDSPSDPNNNNNNNNESSDFFPLAIGSWWKYKVSFDRTTQDFKFDSTVITSKNLVNGKDCFVFVTYIKDKTTDVVELTDTSYYYKEGPKIYKILYNSNTNQREWMLFADIQLDYIKIYEYPITFEVEDEAIFNGLKKYERVIEGPEKFYLGSQTINCIKTKIILTFEGEILKKDGSKEPYLEIARSEFQWFGYNVGLVKNFQPDGDYDRTLIDFYIVKE